MLIPLLFAALQSMPAAPLTLQAEVFSPSELAEFAADSEHTFLLNAPFAVRSVGVYWQGDLHEAELSIIDLQGGTSPWYAIEETHDLAPSHAGSEGAAGQQLVSALIHHYGAPGYAVRLRIPHLEQVQSMSLVWVPSFTLPDAATVPIAPPKQGVTAQGKTLQAPAGYPKPNVYNRSSWAADPPQCSAGYCTVTHIALHHTAGASEYNSPSWAASAANVKAIQAYHMYTRGWCDIGYNYLIDVHGYIFEGRAGGDDVRGAHDSFNCGSMGVAMMGYFHSPYNQTLNQAMQNAFCELAAWKCDQRGIDPLSSSWYAGYGGTMENLYGHRDVGNTACPGDLAYAELPSLRQSIWDKLHGGTQIILDNHQAMLIGNWNTGTSSGDKFGSDYLWASTGTQSAVAYWAPDIPQAGLWSISYWWPQGSNRNPNTLIGARLNGSLQSTHVNQQQSGGQWNVIATVWLPVGNQSLIGLDNSGPGGFVVMADAIRLIKQ